MSYTSGGAISPQLISDELARVLGSSEFRGAARKRRFLQFIVQQTLAGHADRIKAYSIALDVFDRDASFDPLIDPVVRIQAGRIRRSLEQYYLTEGAGNPIRITIPKGNYVPHFVARRAGPEAGEDGPRPEAEAGTHPSSQDGRDGANAPADARDEPAEGPLPPPATPPRQPILAATGPRSVIVAWAILMSMAAILLAVFASVSLSLRPRAAGEVSMGAVRGPSLLVQPFANGTGDPAQDIVAEGFTDDLIGALIRFRNVLVFGAGTSFRFRSASALHDAEPSVRIDYVLKGYVSQVGEQLHINVALISAKDQRYLWADSFRRDFTPATLVDLRQDIAVQVARALAQPQGVIYTEEIRNSAGRSPTTLSAYECMLRTRQYWRQMNAELHAQVRACLERATQTDPLHAEAWAALAMVTVDEVRLGFNPSGERPDPVTTGLHLAMRARELAPDNPLPLQALGLAHWLRREPQLSIAAYEQALALNPNDSDILADLGRCYSLIGDWDKGIPLIREAFARNPAQPNWYRIVLALFHYVHGRYDEALAEARRIDVTDSILPHVALAMIHGQTGDKAEAAREVQEIVRLDPKYGEKVVSELERRNIAAPVVARIVDGLQKAGLAVAPRTPARWNLGWIPPEDR